jgi:hypothetical protein
MVRTDKFPIQLVGPIHVHPNGRFVYLGNRSGVAGVGASPGVEDVGGRKVFSGGESSIAVFAIDQQTGEPTPIAHADIRAAHPRTFGFDPGARLLVAPTAKREGGKVVDIPAGLSVFRTGDGCSPEKPAAPADGGACTGPAPRNGRRGSSRGTRTQCNTWIASCQRDADVP